MTRASAWRCSIAIAVLVGGGLGCSGSGAGSPSTSTAGAAPSSGGHAGESGAGGNGASIGGSAPGTAGSVSSPSGGVGNGAGGASGGAAAGGSAPMSGGASGMTGNAGSSGSGGAGGGSATNCPASDPLKINNAKMDAYDCTVLQLSAKWGMPDPMIVKSQIQQESSFNEFAISGDSPCGIVQGWTDAESKSFGLIQTTPACGEATAALLPGNMHPNLDQDMSSALWNTSVFNPAINLDAGINTDTDSLKALKKKYAGCTDAQYNMMAAGAFNSGDSAVMGCGMYNARAQMYVDAITSHYHGFATAAGWPDPY